MQFMIEVVMVFGLDMLKYYVLTCVAMNVIHVLEIIIQHIFGCFSTPEVCGKKVLLKLLSPARRPLQITDDLESFWKTTWNDICKEMKGRYPKHNWNYKIVTDE